VFRDREQAGRALAEKVRPHVQDKKPLILALPRGGVPVAFEIARSLGADVDVFLVRKLGFPGQEELAIGAIASGGVRVLNEDLIAESGLSRKLVDEVTAREQTELDRRAAMYRQGRPAIPVAGRTIVLVDDGLATGASMLAAARALRPQGAERIIIAVPVAPIQSCEDLEREVDQVICAETPEPFVAVGAWYEDFAQVTDEQVRKLLDGASAKN